MWKGSITFGLVSVPVALYKAVEEHSGPSMHMVHEKDGGRIKLRRFCEAEDVEVPFAEIVKGYESEDGREAIITKADMDDLPLPSKRIIDVLGFVDEGSIDPLRLSSPYYAGVAPKTPAKPYVLLRDAMTQSGKVAITKVTLSTRESLALLRVYGDLIVLQTLLWPDEIREPEGLAPRGESEVRPQELKMAQSLMDTLSEDFDVDALHDDYAAALERLIEAKLEGVPVTAGQPAPVGSGNVIDLMDALQRSVDKLQGRSEAGVEDAEVSVPAKKAVKRAPAKKTSATKAAARKVTAAKTVKKTAAKKTAAKKTSRAS
jgi:DNA end-binding protein Ku